MSLLALFQRTRTTRRPVPAVTIPAVTVPAVAPPPVVAAPVVEEPVDELLHTWQTYVAVRHGALPNSTVIDLTRTAHVATLEVQLDAAWNHYPAVRAETRRIAAALSRPVEQVVIEASTTRRGDRIRVIVVDEHSPLYTATTAPTDPIDAGAGHIRIGAFADGATATWELFNDDGAVHGAIIGASGLGRHRVLRAVLAAANRHPLVDTYVIAQPGDDLAASHLKACTPEAEADTLWRLCTIAARRSDDLHNRRERTWTPSTEQPLKLLVIEDVEAVADTTRLRTLVRIGRKAGIAVVAAAGEATAFTFGDDATRQELARTNLAVLPTTTSTSRNGLGVNHLITDLPAQWPNGTDTRGIAYLPRQRNSAFRADLA